MTARPLFSRRASLSCALLLVAATAASGCDEKPSEPPPARADSVPARSGWAAAPTASPAAASATPAATDQVEPSEAPSASAAAVAPFELRPARKLRDGERAAAERAFSEYARFDFAQSFVVELEGFGSCSFVTQTTEEATRARIAAKGGAPDKPPSPTGAPTAAAAATSTGATPAASTAAPAASTAAPAAAAGDDRAVPSFHLVCKAGRVYDLPRFGEVDSSWTFDAVDAVAFSDIDADDDADVIVIASYMTGIGPEGAKPFPVVILFRNEGKGFFSLLTDLSNELTKARADSVAKVVAQLKEKTR